MPRWVIVLAVIAAAMAFAWAVPIARLFGAFQLLGTGLSIMMAAVFVRLNRGMPTLDWKSLEPLERIELTAQILNLTREYALIVAINAATLITVVTLFVIGDKSVDLWPPLAGRSLSGLLGAMMSLVILRMGYVVWRDYDVVKLQKALIDRAAEREVKEENARVAAAKIADMRAAGLRPMAAGDPKPWTG